MPDAGLALEDERRPQAHDPDRGLVALEAIENALDLGLVARIEGGLDAAGRPALVHPAVLRARRVGADRGGVDQCRNARRRDRVEHALAALDVRGAHQLRSRPGWISQARWITASAPRNSGTRSALETSACAQSVFGSSRPGGRRAMPRIESTAGSRASERRTLVPTLPDAPVTTTLMPTAATRAPAAETVSIRTASVPR